MNTQDIARARVGQAIISLEAATAHINNACAATGGVTHLMDGHGHLCGVLDSLEAVTRLFCECLDNPEVDLDWLAKQKLGITPVEAV